MLQKGRRSRSLSIILLALILVAVFASLAVSERAKRPTYGRSILPMGQALKLDPTGRHNYVAHGVPGVPRPQSKLVTPANAGVVTPASSGPTPDTDLTPSAFPAIGTFSPSFLEPSAAPSATQNEVVFVSNGVDLVAPFGTIDPTLPPFSLTFTGNFNIWTMRSDGSQMRQVPIVGPLALFDKREPVFDPSGRLIYFSSNATGTWEIYKCDKNTGITVQVTNRTDSPGNKHHPTCSPNSLLIAYACDITGHSEIFGYLTDGSQGQFQITSDFEDNLEPSWNPNNANDLLYTHTATGVTNIYRIDPITTPSLGSTPVSSGGGDATTSDKQAVFSHDGLQIAFASNRNRTGGGSPEGFYNVWRMDSLGEAGGGLPATLVSDKDLITASQDSDYPSWLTPLADRNLLRLFYVSRRPSPVGSPGGRSHIWSTLIDDNTPPVLQDLPWVDNRLPQPGNDITIFVPVFDKDSGVAHVYAQMKNPDNKVYFTSSELFDTAIPGNRYQEWNYANAGARVEMFDDGDTATNGDLVAGDGIFTGKFTTLVAPEDYVIDIQTEDVAGNTLTYDNVYGFSTQPFTPTKRLLFVNDYCEGQKFLTNFLAPTVQQSLNNMFPAAWMTESYWTTNPGFAPSALGTIDFDSINGYARSQGVTLEDYDTWRVICRGAVPPNIYQFYLPNIEYQLDPADAVANPKTAQATKPVTVAERAVIWACPHAGDVWVGTTGSGLRPAEATGSLIDGDTQFALGNYLANGGRLFIGGENIAWALTLNNTAPNSDFMTRALHASFVSDTIGLNVTKPAPNRAVLGTDWGFTINGVAGNPVAAGVPGGPAAGPFYDEPTALVTPRQPAAATDPTYTDANDWSIRPDRILPLNASETLYNYGGGGVGGLNYIDPITQSRVVYLAFGFEQIHRQYGTRGTPAAPYCKNMRSHLMHNAISWMSTGTLEGRVTSISDGGQPVTNPDPIVYLFAGANPPANAVPLYAVRCQDDGTHIIQGLAPGTYSIQVQRSGYDIAHYDAVTIQGAWQPQTVDLALTRPRPGSILGTVVSDANPLVGVPGITVRAYRLPVGTDTTPAPAGPPYLPADLIGNLVATTTTIGDGSYVLPGLSVGDNPNYVIVANDNYGSPAHATNPAYGTSSQQVATVTSGGVTTVNITLPAAPGSLRVHVQGNPAPPTPGPIPLDSAIVRVLDLTGNVVATGTTDGTGNTVPTDISVTPGIYRLTVDRVGYNQGVVASVTITSTVTTSLTVTLNYAPDGFISGRVTSANTGNLLGGVTIQISSGAIVVTTTTSATATADGAFPAYNYRVQVPAGQLWQVQPIAPGQTITPPLRQPVVVTSNLTTRSQDFTISSVHSFPRGLQLVSTPYGYDIPAVDPADLLGISPASSLQMATWSPAAGAYRVYPNAPADHFRIGAGYWLNLANLVDVTRIGTAATDPITIPLEQGWNLVGTPSLVPLNLYKIQFKDYLGDPPMAFQTALASGKLSTSLFAYILGSYRSTTTMYPWVGYWIKTDVALQMIVSPSVDVLASGSSSAPVHSAATTPAGGWLLPISTAVDGMVDDCTFLGMSSKTADAYQPGQDMAKPPAADMAAFVYTAAVEKGWGSSNGNYAVDLKPASAGKATWDLSVRTSQVGAPVTLTWGDLSSLPRGVRPLLVDLDSGRKVYMRTVTSYAFTAGSAARRLQVVIDPAQTGGLTVSGIAAQQAGGGTAIVYTLSRAAAVDVEIRNISGAVVKRVASGAVETAGRCQTLWNGRNEGGNPVPQGRYLVTVKARTDEGQETTAITSLMVGR